MFFLLRIRNCLRDKRITGKLEIIGYVNNISQLIEMADVLAFPSNVVHQLRPGIEAGYYKKPVILSDFEETKEYFIDGYNALVFQPGNAKGLADCIKRMYYDEKLRVTLGENNQKMTANYHNYEFVKSKLIAFLRIV